MKEVFLLINCDLGKEHQVISHLQSLDAVKEVQAINGVYDVIAKLETDTEGEVNDIIRSELIEIKPIHSVLTLWAQKVN